MSRLSSRLRVAGSVLVVCTGLFGAGTAVHAQTTGAAGGGTAVLRDASGRTVGTAVFTETSAGMRITFSGTGLPAGPHGIHVHAVGQCEGPEFTSAGGHFNPANRQHGTRNPQGPHAGDLPNLMAAANGAASYSATNAMMSLGAGPNSLFDADGSSLVIHASADDEVTDPTGNSGGRLACGTIIRGASALPATGGAGALALGGPAIGAGALAMGVGLLLAGRRVRRRAA